MYLKTHFSYSYISSLNLPYFKKWYFYSELNVISNLDRQADQPLSKRDFLKPCIFTLNQLYLKNVPNRPNQMYL